MKTILTFLIAVLMFSSCDEDSFVKIHCKQGQIRILNKKYISGYRGGPDIYKFYLYDGTSAYWSYTDRITFERYAINDTLPTIVIIKTYVERNE